MISMIKNDKVQITCYGQTQTYNRKDAIKEFKIAKDVCEGHEQMRYEYIYECLLAGDTVIDDDNV